MSRSLRVRNQINHAEVSSPEPVITSGRPRRTTSSQQKSYHEDFEYEDEDEDDEDDETEGETITVKHPSQQQHHQQPPQAIPSIKLKLKMPASKLRESTTPKTVISVNSRDSFEPAELVTGPRSSRAKRQVIMESDSEDEEDEELEDEDEDAEGDDQNDEDAEGEDEEDEDAEGESDVEMEDMPTPPVIRTTGPASKPTITITSAPKAGKIKSVEAKEISMATGTDFDDDDLSDLSDEENIMEDDAIEEGEDDAEGDSFDDDDMSRSGTPDLSKMTKRQRAIAETGTDDHFMALNMGPQTKLHLTDEQRNLRRMEMARRRKNLSEKRNEEEKQDTINRLLKKQAPKRRGKISAAEIAAGAETPDIPMTGLEEEAVKADPVFSRWISGSRGIKMGLPAEWKDRPVAAGFGSGGWKVVEEVEV